jgi:hypothetical protein
MDVHNNPNPSGVRQERERRDKGRHQKKSTQTSNSTRGKVKKEVGTREKEGEAP